MIPLRAQRAGESWTVDVVERDGTEVDVLQPIAKSGRIRWSLDQTSTLTLDTASKVPDLTGRLLRPRYACNGESYTLGLWWPKTAYPSWDGRVTSWSVDALDLTGALGAAALGRSVPLYTSTPVAETVESRIRTRFRWLPVSIGDTDETLRADLVLDAGQSELDLIEKLLDAGGYTPLSPALDGTLRSARWMPPATRQTALGFAADSDAATAALVPKVASQTRLRRPNAVYLIAVGSSANPGLVGRWADESPSSPGSIPNIGEESHSLRGDATSQEAADAQAAREAARVRAEGRTDTWTGPWQPVLPGDVVTVDYPAAGVTGRRELTAVEVSMLPGAITTFTGREVTE